MKFKKGFGVILEPDDNIKEEVSEEEQSSEEEGPVEQGIREFCDFYWNEEG